MVTQVLGFQIPTWEIGVVYWAFDFGLLQSPKAVRFEDVLSPTSSLINFKHLKILASGEGGIW